MVSATNVITSINKTNEVILYMSNDKVIDVNPS